VDQVKLMKRVGLAMVVTGVAMPFVGAGSASAETVLCEVEETPCKEADWYPKETKVEAELQEGTQATLKTNVGNVTCQVSEVGAQTKQIKAQPLDLQIPKVTLKECTFKELPCTVEVSQLPWLGELQAQEAEQGNGSLNLAKHPESGYPGLFVECAPTLNCALKVTKAKLKVKGGEPAKIETTEVVLEPLGFICPETAELIAKYTVTAPNPMYVETP
jgi:hypothetical protein